jgi:hypothetical protein
MVLTLTILQLGSYFKLILNDMTLPDEMLMSDVTLAKKYMCMGALPAAAK